MLINMLINQLWYVNFNIIIFYLKKSIPLILKIDIQGTDVAAAMSGKRNGAKVFLKSYMPFAISCRCVAH